MSGTTSRNKGRRGEREAAHLLEERGYTIIELGPGRKTEDIVADDANGARRSIEVKNHVVWHLPTWRKQAKEQARRRQCAWLLMCRIPDRPGTFYVESDNNCSVWRGNIAKKA